MSDSMFDAAPAPWEDAASAPQYPEFDDGDDEFASESADEAAANAVFGDSPSDSSETDDDTDDDAPVSPEKETLIDQIASEFVGFWNLLVSRTNWEKGKVIHSWRTKLIEAGLPRRIYSDESIAQKLGNVSAQHVGRLRRVYERFGASEPLPNLFWSHYQAALDWDDAEDWLKKASDEKLSIAQTRTARWEKYGAPQSRKPKDSEIVASEPDEDVNPFNDSNADFSDFDPEGRAGAEFEGDVERGFVGNPNGGRREYDDGPVTPTETRLDGESGEGKRKCKKGAKDGDADLGEYEGDAEPWEAESTKQTTADVLDGIAKLDPLPTDLGEAFEALKVAILTRKLSKWDDVQPVQVAAYLSAMKRLLVAEDK